MTKASLKPGIYEHYKGKRYELLGTARHTETEEVLAVYRQLYDTPDFPHGSLWVRPLSMFLETVEAGGRSVPRFRYLGEPAG